MTDIFEANGARFLAKDDMIVRWLRQKPGRVFEPATFAWLMDVLASREGAFVDVGASTGWFAIPVALMRRPVIAVEANERVRVRLRENCRLNAVAPRIIDCAASDRDGEAVFMHNPLLPLTSGGSLEAVVVSTPAREIVPVRRLDGLIEAGERIAAMKIDVEGHELAVLAGAADIIMTERPALVLEANTDRHVQWLGAWCAEHGYDWHIADERNLLCSPQPAS